MIDKSDLIETILYKYAQGVTFNNASKGEAINITDLKPIIDLFVEQACDLIEGQTIRTEMDNFDAGYNTALNDIENAIRDKFK